MKTIVVGLGNPILGDDGVGWRVVKEVTKRWTPLSSPSLPSPTGREAGGEGNQVDFDCLSLGGLGLMEHLIGYDRAILVDAFERDDAPAGSISILKLSQLPNYSAYHITSAHDTSLQKAMELGREMGAPLPEDVIVIGIATERIHEFSEDLSPPVAGAVPCVANIVLDLIAEISKEEDKRHGHPQG